MYFIVGFMYFIVGLWYNKPTIKLFLEEVRHGGSREEKYIYCC